MKDFEDKDFAIFAGIRGIVLTFKHDLDVIAEIKKEHDSSIKKLCDSLEEYEVFLKEKYGIDIELCHLSKHADFLDDEKMSIIRKRILDYGNSLRREVENSN